MKFAAKFCKYFSVNSFSRNLDFTVVKSQSLLLLLCFRALLSSPITLGSGNEETAIAQGRSGLQEESVCSEAWDRRAKSSCVADLERWGCQYKG